MKRNHHLNIATLEITKLLLSFDQIKLPTAFSLAAALPWPKTPEVPFRSSTTTGKNLKSEIQFLLQNLIIILLYSIVAQLIHPSSLASFRTELLCRAPTKLSASPRATVSSSSATCDIV
jgi:hypothetical protein